jgi:hypothetical protein
VTILPRKKPLTISGQRFDVGQSFAASGPDQISYLFNFKFDRHRTREASGKSQQTLGP